MKPKTNAKTKDGALAVKDLNENPANPRLPFTDEQEAAFKKAYAKFGDLGVIVANQRANYRLVGGHKRKGALVDLYPKANIVMDKRLEKPDAQGTVAWGFVVTEDGRYALRVVDWDEQTEKAANLAANQFGAEFDWNAVGEMLKSISGEALDLTGFTAEEIKKLIAPETAPEGFASYNVNVSTQYCCPKCGYKWSGKSE